MNPARFAISCNNACTSTPAHAQMSGIHRVKSKSRSTLVYSVGLLSTVKAASAKPLAVRSHPQDQAQAGSIPLSLSNSAAAKLPLNALLSNKGSSKASSLTLSLSSPCSTLCCSASEKANHACLDICCLAPRLRRICHRHGCHRRSVHCTQQIGGVVRLVKADNHLVG